MMIPSAFMPDICQNCSEVILYVSVLRHDTSSYPVEQLVYPRFCPFCGAKLDKKSNK